MKTRAVILFLLLIHTLFCVEIFAQERHSADPANASVTNESKMTVNVRITKSDGTTEDQLVRPDQTLELPVEAANVKTSFPTKKQLRRLSEEERAQVSAMLFPELNVILTQPDGTLTRVDGSFLGPGTSVVRLISKEKIHAIPENQKRIEGKNNPLSASAPQEKPSSAWTYDRKGYEAAMARQKTTGEPAALYFHAVWCPYCAKFEKDILASGQVRQGLSETLKVKIDVEKERDLAHRYGIDSFPQFLIVPFKGEFSVLDTSVSPEQFLKDCRRAIRRAGLKIQE